MSAIGVQNHVQPNPSAIPLTDGIHLRWQFAMERGFPWHGYYLFRRQSPVSTNTASLRIMTAGWLGIGGVQEPYHTVAPLVHNDNIMLSEIGNWISDQAIVLIDQFSPPNNPGGNGMVEFDLENRLFQRIIFNGLPAKRVVVNLAFKAPGASIDVHFLYNNQTVHQVTLDAASNNATFPFQGYEFEADAITGVEFSGGQAAVLNISYEPSIHDLDHTGWSILPGVQFPLSLPADSPTYPSPTKPGSFALAEAMAQSRIAYGNAQDRIDDSFEDIHDQLLLLLAGGPGGTSQHEVSGEHFEEGELPTPGDKALRMSNQRPLDLLVLGAIEPSIAQLIGMYHVDQTAVPGQLYDYFLVADHDGSFATLIQTHTAGNVLDVQGMLQYAFDPANVSTWDTIDGWKCSNRSLAFSPSLSTPDGLHAYALPGITIRDEETGLIANAGQVNSAGFTWDLNLGLNGAILPYQAVTYQIWRESHGANEPAAAGVPGSYVPTTPSPFLVAKSQAPSEELAFEPPVQKTSSQFPPFRLLAFDNYLADGWYSYRVTGMDLFGRHTQFSPPATWHQWSPHPSPLPHYYNPFAANTEVHPFAVHLLDETPPPPPTGIEASALDPLDNYIVKDAAYDAWRLMLEAEPWFQALSPTQQNELCGLRVRWKWTQFQMRQAPDTDRFRIHYSGGSFIKEQGRVSAIAPSGADLLLTLEMSGTFDANEFQGDLIQIGPHSYPVKTSSAGFPTQVTIADKGQTIAEWARFTLRTDHSIAHEWDHHLLEVDYDAHIGESIRVVNDPAGNSLEGSPTLGDGAAILGNVADLPNSFDLSAVRIGFDQILLFQPNGGEAEIHVITDVDIPGRRIITANPITLTGFEAAWRIGVLVRQYEAFLPDANGNMQNGVPDLHPSLEHPTVYGNVSVSAIDEGNHEGRVAAPAKVYRVLREVPPAPIPPPPDSDNVYASPADYQGNSYYTYRWSPSQHLKTHIYRALDESLFLEDYASRPKAPADPDLNISSADLSIFPDEALEPLWDQLKRDTIATELNALNAVTRAAANAKAALPAYRDLSNDALRVLGGLSQVDKAFSQVTLKALDPDDASNDDKRGPDNPDNYPLSGSLRAYIDTLPGKARNRYFYRAAYVDGAENVSAMSQSSVPVYLPDVAPPKSPKISKATGGDREIRLEWAASPEKNLTRIRMYRTSDKDAARDIRLMGEPVADLPGETLVMQDGLLNIGAETDISSIERAYNAAELGNNDDPFLGESATQLPANIANLQNGVLSIAGIPNGTPVVLVYFDSHGTRQRTPCLSRRRLWTDSTAPAGVKMYYRPTYVKQTEINGQIVEVNSEPGRPVVAQAFTSQIPETPTINNMEWVLIEPDTYSVEDWPASGILPSDRIPAVRLQVQSSESEPQFFLNRKTREQTLWRTVSAPLQFTGPGTYELLDPAPDPANYQSYRVKVVAASGLASEGYSPQEIAPPTIA